MGLEIFLMKFYQLSEKQVLDANLTVYNKKSIEDYERNPSIFEVSRQEEIKKILSELNKKTGDGYLLDIGCGTGNLTKLAQSYFQRVLGLDIAWDLLGRVKQHRPDLKLIIAEAHYLPFRNALFDCITLYGTLHHLFDPQPVLNMAFQALKKNGILYTDHDPNYFFTRFYHHYYQLRYRKQPGFGTTEEEIAEYHHTQTPGLNPIKLRAQLLKIGFKQVRIYYRHTCNPSFSLPYRFFLAVFKIFSYLMPLKSLYTHFYIIARK